MKTFLHTLDRDEQGELEVEVSYIWQHATRGRRNKWGAPEEPDEPEGALIMGVKTAQGAEVGLLVGEYDEIVEAAEEDAEE